MSFNFADIARHAASDGGICAEEILEMRRAGWADARICRPEAEAIFRAQQATSNPSAEWSDFFVEAISNFVLNGSQPRGFASEDEAAWLVAQVKMDGKICSMTELELLTRTIERAQNVPESLKSFVLETLESEVMTGTGPTRCGGELSDCHVSEAECRILRRVIFGQASDRPAAVSQREAELLFRLKDRSLADANAAEFERLFVQGVGNYLMGFASTNAQVSAERMLELEAFVADNKPQISRFVGQMAKSSPNVLGTIFGKKKIPPMGREALIAQASELTVLEHDWLEAQMAKNGQTDRYDRALLDFLVEEVPG